jgi:translation initiation factor IF-1
MIPEDDYARGVVVALLPNRRCTVRLDNRRLIVGRIPYFVSKHNLPYCPEPGHEVTVYLKEYDGEFLLAGFPRVARRRPVEVIPVTGFDPEGEPEIWIMSNGSLSVVFEFLPPTWAEEDSDSFDDFDQQLAQATGVAVDWEDAEVFRIPNPAADTVKRLRKFLSAYRRR